MTTTHVQGADPTSSGSGLVYTVGFTPTNIGDLILFVFAQGTQSITATVTDNGITSGWNFITRISTANPPAGVTELWWAKSTSTSAGTVTMTYASTPSTNPLCDFDEYHSTIGNTPWSVQQPNTLSNPTNSLTVTFPAITSGSSGQLYHGISIVNGTGATGSTSGFTYRLTPNNNVVAYNLNCAAATVEQPTATQSPTNTFTDVAVIMDPNPIPPSVFEAARSFTAVSRAATFFSRVPWHEKRNGLLLPQPGLVLAEAH